VARVKLTPSARRLRALMEILGFEGRGAQTRFAKEIGVSRSRLNNALVYGPLSRQLAEKIIATHPSVFSFVIPLNAGHAVETAMAGRDGGVGVSSDP
jgi:hypothetical protein